MHAFGRGQGFVQSSITFRPRQYPRLTTAAVSGGAFAYLRLRDATNGPYSTSARGRMLTGSHWRLKTQRPSLPVRQPPYDAVCSSLFATAALFEAIRQGRRFSTWPAALLLLIQPRRREASGRHTPSLRLPRFEQIDCTSSKDYGSGDPCKLRCVIRP
jgi:hypothetical protein